MYPPGRKHCSVEQDQLCRCNRKKVVHFCDVDIFSNECTYNSILCNLALCSLISGLELVFVYLCLHLSGRKKPVFVVVNDGGAVTSACSGRAGRPVDVVRTLYGDEYYSLHILI